MKALAQCWYTRAHRPMRERHRQPDGSVTSTCRYCDRAVVSWDRTNWTLADGLDVSRLAELTQGRLLTLVDTLDDLVLRRFPVGHIESEGEIDAFKQALRHEYALDEPGSTLVLRDSGARRRATASPPRGLPLSGAA